MIPNEFLPKRGFENEGGRERKVSSFNILGAQGRARSLAPLRMSLGGGRRSMDDAKELEHILESVRESFKDEGVRRLSKTESISSRRRSTGGESSRVHPIGLGLGDSTPPSSSMVEIATIKNVNDDRKPDF